MQWLLKYSGEVLTIDGKSMADISCMLLDLVHILIHYEEKKREWKMKIIHPLLLNY